MYLRRRHQSTSVATVAVALRRRRRRLADTAPRRATPTTTTPTILRMASSYRPSPHWLGVTGDPKVGIRSGPSPYADRLFPPRCGLPGIPLTNRPPSMASPGPGHWMEALEMGSKTSRQSLVALTWTCVRRRTKH